MAELLWGQYRKGRAVNVRQGRTVDIDLSDVAIADTAGEGVDLVIEPGDTLDLRSLGLREVHEIWVDLDGYTMDLSDPKEASFSSVSIAPHPQTIRFVGV